jgi:ankyrin repeat protein
VIAQQGDTYLFEGIVQELELRANNLLNSSIPAKKFNASLTGQLSNMFGFTTGLHTLVHQFVNAVDLDFSTPLVLALKHQRNNLVRYLLSHEKICLKQSSQVFGTAIHVCLANQNFKSALKILQKLLQHQNFVAELDLNKMDDDGNTLFHLLFKYFSSDVHLANQIGSILLNQGALINLRNKQLQTPLSTACFYSQGEAVRFALKHTSKFDFNERAGRTQQTILHQAVSQNNFNLISLLLNSDLDLDLNAQDTEGRVPLDLCNSISSVYKMLRKQWRMKRTKVINKYKPAPKP